jgi:hypothetical protein
VKVRLDIFHDSFFRAKKNAQPRNIMIAKKCRNIDALKISENNLRIESQINRKIQTFLTDFASGSLTGLPYFSWYNIPKRGKICQMAEKLTKWPKNRPKWPKNTIILHFKVWDFWFEKIQSGNPVP